MKENLKLTWFLTFFIPAFLFADRAPQDTWYLDRELKLPEMPGFKNPRGITFGPSGYSYVADNGNHAITIWDQNGSMIKRFGTHGSGDGQFSHPIDIAVTNDEIYVVEKNNHRVQVFDINGSFLRKWGSSGSGDSQFNQPFSISLDMNGTVVNEVFIADRYNYKAKVFDANGTFKRTIGSGMISESTGISFGPDGLLYLSSCRANKIEVFETNGTHVRTFSTTMNPYHIDFHGDKLAVSAYDNHKLEVFDKNGTALSVIGSYGNNLGLFNHALGVAFDSLGNLHVADTNNHRIQVLDSNYSHLRSYGVWGSGV
jgi:streptogramin lyase